MEEKKVTQQQLKETLARIEEMRKKSKQKNIDDIPLEKSILIPERFEKAIALYQTTSNEHLKHDLIYSLGKYVWYNYYQNINIKKDSPEDLANERIYKALEITDKDLYQKIEKRVDFQIDKLKNPGNYLY